METESQVCLGCYQGITNPICEKCHTRQLALWLNDYGIDPRIIQYIIRRLRKNFSLETLNDAPCIICNTEMVSTCTYCFFFKVERVLRELDLPEEMIEQFLQIFNYKLYNSVYSSKDD